MYNSYEEYMQSVLGMNLPNTYGMPNYNSYGFEPRTEETYLQNTNRFYPEIYGIVYPMVQKVCARQGLDNINETMINEMTQEVYLAIETGEDIKQGQENGNMQKNGDVKNPRAKENKRPNQNYLLRDLIKILIIRELLQGRETGGMQPPRPRPGMPEMGGRPPILRPGYMGMYP